MRRNTVILALAAVAMAILAYAWIDGGREPVRTVIELVPVPGTIR